MLEQSRTWMPVETTRLRNRPSRWPSLHQASQGSVAWSAGQRERQLDKSSMWIPSPSCQRGVNSIRSVLLKKHDCFTNRLTIWRWYVCPPGARAWNNPNSRRLAKAKDASFVRAPSAYKAQGRSCRNTVRRIPGSVSRYLYVGWTITATHLFDVRFPVFDQGTRFFDHIADVLRVLVDGHGDLEWSHTERQVKPTQAQGLPRRLTSKDVAESVKLVRTDYDQGKDERFAKLNKCL